jgi:hypothetical protein
VPQGVWARRVLCRWSWSRCSWCLDACYGGSRFVGVAPSGVIQSRGRGAGSEGIGDRDPLRLARWAGW